MITTIDVKSHVLHCKRKCVCSANLLKPSEKFCSVSVTVHWKLNQLLSNQLGKCTYNTSLPTGSTTNLNAWYTYATSSALCVKSY